MIRSLICLGVVGALFVTATAQAQEDVVTQLYGQGVHDYFAGRHFEAQKNLNAAVNAGSQDPRVYYFRGLVNQRLGYEGAAEGDFSMAADLEARAGLSEAVGRALTRVQGHDRNLVEKHRTEARLAIHRERAGRRRDRYEADPDRGRPIEELDQPVEDDLPLPDETEDDTFDDTEPDLLDDLDDAEPVDAPDESDDLFGDGPADEPADEPADDPADDPLEDDDLFGEDPAEKPMDDAADPFEDDAVQPDDGAEMEADGDAGDGGDGADPLEEIEEDPF